MQFHDQATHRPQPVFGRGVPDMVAEIDIRFDPRRVKRLHERGGEFRFGTDHAVYLRHALMVMQRHADLFEWVVEKPADWQTRPSGWPETRYEHKARTVYGHEVWYFRFRRR